MSKTNFKVGCCGNHLGCLISTNLVIFDLEVILLLHVSFNLNRPTVREEKSKICFQDGGHGSHFGFPISAILAFFIYMSTCCHIVNVNLIHLVVCKKMSKTDFTIAYVAAILDFRSTGFYLISIQKLYCCYSARFGSNWLKVENWFSRRRLGQPC